MIPRHRPYLKILDFLNFLISPEIAFKQVEKSFAQRANCKFALLLPYGRSAYYFLLKAYSITNQEVILPAYTCEVLLAPILETNNSPICIDSTENGFNMDINQVHERINHKTKMIIFSEIWGDPILSRSIDQYKGRGIFLVGDYSLSLFSFLENGSNRLNSLDIIFFSFASGKEISALGGGMLLTNNEEIFTRIQTLRNSICHAPSLRRRIKVFIKAFVTMIAFSSPFYRISIFLSEKTTLLNNLKEKPGLKLPNDFFLLPTKFQLYLIQNRLDRVKTFIFERNKALNLYYKELTAHGIAHFHPFEMASSIALNCKEKTVTYFQKALLKRQVHASSVYKRTLPDVLSQDDRLYPNAKNLVKNLIMLPLFYGIKEAEIKYIVQVLKEQFRSKS
jgi:dTDP-4-amino-4,6-dideoxygalactose transaminase